MTSPLAAARFRAIVPPLLDDALSLAKWLARDADDAALEAARRMVEARLAEVDARAYAIADGREVA